MLLTLGCGRRIRTAVIWLMRPSWYHLQSTPRFLICHNWCIVTGSNCAYSEERQLYRLLAVHPTIQRKVEESNGVQPSSLQMPPFSKRLASASAVLSNLAEEARVQLATACTVSRFERGGLGKCPTLPWRKALEFNQIPCGTHPLPTEPRNVRDYFPKTGGEPRTRFPNPKVPSV